MAEPGDAGRRIVVKGTSGVGKSTLCEAIAARLGVPFIELDALHHGPNWAAPTNEVFRQRVAQAMADAPDGWVIDGNYDSKLGDLVTTAADTIVWLDLPLRVTMPRLWKRTMQRIVNKTELWNGNRETWRDQFASRESIFIWTVKAHRKHRREWPLRFAGDPRLVRLRSSRDVETWLDALP
jgi:adenylate kinase family enzyme